MKKLFLFIFFFLYFATSLYAAPVVKDEVLLTQGKDSYQGVRHIVIKGTNEEIGKALGDVAQKDYGVTTLLRYPDEVYARVADKYLRQNYPILRDRAKGVATSYKEDYETSLSLFNQLVYDAGPWNGCSSAYYPPALTDSGTGYLGHNMDYPLNSITQLLRLPEENIPNMFTRNFVIELYPDKGYASIGVGTGDVMSIVSGMNEKGLVAVLHTDNYTLINTSPKPDYSGLIFPTQVLRCILDNCSTLEEAKELLLNNKISLTFEPAHLLIADISGRSMCVEINPSNMRIEFTDNPGKVQIFTNHPIYRFRNPAEFPDYTPFQEDNTFARFNNLRKLTDGKNKFTAEDVFSNQQKVQARWNNLGRGQANPMPNRTIYTDLYEQKAGVMKVKFYLRDGKIDPETGDPEDLVYSDLFTFKLQKPR